MRSLLRAAASLYGVAVRARSAAYNLGMINAREVQGLKVISVGGVRAGGDGKTPLALHIALELERRGEAVALLCRGYRGRWERRGGLVSAGDGRVRAELEDAGDEALLLASRAPRVPVVVGADRVEAAERARALGAEVVVLDSGFQHRRLARHLDVATASWPVAVDEALLPRGHLREPISSLGRADLIGYELTTGELPPLFRDGRDFTFNLQPDCLVDASLAPCGNIAEIAGVGTLLVTGIARPHRFERAARALGANIAGVERFPDHHAYGPRDWKRITGSAVRRGVDMVLTTEKDMVRLAPFARGGGIPPLHALRVSVRLHEGAEALDAALSKALDISSLAKL